jgi:CRP-like cAMP-binding protein
MHQPDTQEIWPLPSCPEAFAVRDYARNEFFLVQGERPTYLGFVRQGIFREYFSGSSKKEYNRSFCTKGDFAGPYHDLSGVEPKSASPRSVKPKSATPQSVEPLAGPSVKPSAVSVQALTSGSLLLIPLDEFNRLILTDMVWLKAAREIAHGLLMKKFERENQLLTLSALERYDLLEQRYPQLIQQIPAYHIASYLGITPISLSRLRSRRF